MSKKSELVHILRSKIYAATCTEELRNSMDSLSKEKALLFVVAEKARYFM